MAKSSVDIAQKTKDLLSDIKNRIKLDDFVTQKLKAFISKTSLENFPVQAVGASKENFLDRMQKYEEMVKDLQQIVILLAKWGEGEQLKILEKIFSRLGETDKGSAGFTLWLHFGWYPINLLMYSAGIAAISAQNYQALKIVLTAKIRNPLSERDFVPIMIPTVLNLSDIHDEFKWVPGEERKHAPRSEHLFKILEPTIQTALFIGKDYERFFDDFEVYVNLVFADLTDRNWGPIGRFGYKFERDEEGDNPFLRILGEAKKQKAKWPLIHAGMFNGSESRFLEIAGRIEERLAGLSWF